MMKTHYIHLKKLLVLMVLEHYNLKINEEKIKLIKSKMPIKFREKLKFNEHRLIFLILITQFFGKVKKLIGKICKSSNFMWWFRL